MEVYFDDYILISKIKEQSDRFIIQELKKRNVEGIVPSHGGIIMSLYNSPGSLTMNEVGQFIGKTNATTSVLVNKLCDLGMVVRKKDEDDGRIIRVNLTQKGEEFAKIVIEIAEDLYSHYNRALNEEERCMMNEFLSRLSKELHI